MSRDSWLCYFVPDELAEMIVYWKIHEEELREEGWENIDEWLGDLAYEGFQEYREAGQ